MNEFIVKVETPAVSGNFDDMKKSLALMMQAYAGLEVTEDNIPERKKDLATLRKIKKAVEDKRKEVKKEYEKPIKAFESKCKELTGIIDTEANRINDSLAGFEAKRVAEKRKQVERLYADTIGGFEEYLPLNQIYQNKWDNKTCAENEIVYNMQEMLMSVKSDIETIRSTCGEYADECLVRYKNGGRDLRSALQRANDLRNAKERAEADLRRKEAEVREIPKEEVKTPSEPQNGRKKWVFAVFTEKDAESIRVYMEMFGLEYEEV